MIHMLLVLIRLHQNPGRKELLAEVSVVQFYTEHSLQKILELTYGKFLWQQIEGNRRPQDILLEHSKTVKASDRISIWSIMR